MYQLEIFQLGLVHIKSFDRIQSADASTMMDTGHSRSLYENLYIVYIEFRNRRHQSETRGIRNY